MKPLLRYTLPILLTLSWGVAVYLMWRGLTTVPSADRLAESRLVPIPTPASFARELALSATELGAVVALSWPGRRLLLRLWLAALGAWTWFFATAPLGINTVQWAHRRWLAAVAFWLLVTAVVAAARALVRRGRGTDRPATE